jgi:hypothetical protein
MPRRSRRAASTPTIPFTVDDAGFYTKDAPGSARMPKAARPA